MFQGFWKNIEKGLFAIIKTFLLDFYKINKLLFIFNSVLPEYNEGPSSQHHELPMLPCMIIIAITA